MNFRPELAAKVIAGEKTATRRLVSSNPRSPWFEGGCSLKVGQDYAICPGRGKNAIGRARVVGTTLRPLGLLTDEEARCEGFDSAGSFEAAWWAINGGYDQHDLVWVVELEALR